MLLTTFSLSYYGQGGNASARHSNANYSTAETTQSSNSSAQIIDTLNYELKWQNEPGAPFSCTICTSAYQFIDVDLVVTSYQNFTAGSPVEIFAWGTMSESFNETGLEYVRLAYDNSTQYSNTNGIVQTPYGLKLNVVPDQTDTGESLTFSVGSFVKLTSQPVNVTWKSSGGPFYPRLDLHYYTGHEFNYEFTNAPVQIEPTSEQTVTTVQNIGIIYEMSVPWVVGVVAIVTLEFLRKKSWQREVE